jgi:hypothetical protein
MDEAASSLSRCTARQRALRRDDCGTRALLSVEHALDR